jgi:hypothetical protein
MIFIMYLKHDFIAHPKVIHFILKILICFVGISFENLLYKIIVGARMNLPNNYEIMHFEGST